MVKEFEHERQNNSRILAVWWRIAMNIIDWLGIIAGLYQERLLDWAAIVIYGRLPLTIVATVFFQLGQLFCRVLGIIFAALLLKFTAVIPAQRLAVWYHSRFSIYAITSAIRLPCHPFSCGGNCPLSFGFTVGLVLARTLNRLERCSCVSLSHHHLVSIAGWWLFICA